MASVTRNQIIIGIVSPIIVGLVLAFVGKDSAFMNGLTNKIFKQKYILEGTILNVDKPLSAIEVMLDNDPNLKATTGALGKFIFPDILKGAHTYAFTYKGVYRTYNQVISGKIELIQVSCKLENEVSSDLAADEHEEIHGSADEDTETADIVALAEVVHNDIKVIKNFTEVAKYQVTEQRIAEPEPLGSNEIMELLELHVSKDKNDVINKGKQQAYTYHLKGEAALLDMIEEVYYQRNHKTFREFGKYYISSKDRDMGFAFKRYQWGAITNVMVSIKLKSGTQSNVLLKEIIYD